MEFLSPKLQFKLFKQFNKEFLSPKLQLELFEQLDMESRLMLYNESDFYFRDSLNDFIENTKKISKFINLEKNQKPVKNTQSTSPIITLDHLIKDLPLSTKCRGNGLKIIPFLERMTDRTLVCTIKSTFSGAKFLRSIIVLKRLKDDTFVPDIPEGLDKEISLCRQPLIIISLGLFNLEREGMSHSNIIIINKNLKTYERFEPFGMAAYEFYNVENVEKFMIGKFANLLDPGYHYLKPFDFCFRYELIQSCVGVDSGLCAVQSTIYAQIGRAHV